MAVVPATQEAEAGELFETGEVAVVEVEITSLHSSLDDRVRLCLKKKKKGQKVGEEHLNLLYSL